MKDLVLVVGASGTVGRELVQLLKAENFRVRATTSQKVKASDSLVPINLATGEGIQAAFEGVDRAFFLSPPGYADQYALLSPLIQEAKRRGLKKVVLMTAMGANAVETSPFRRAEIELEKSGLNYNIIRPNWFMQNFGSMFSHSIVAANLISLPAGLGKASFIDARDIAGVAAKLLTSETFNRQALDLSGPEAVDHAEVARVLSKVTGRTIQYADANPDEFKAKLLSAGLPADYASFLIMIFGFLKEGYNARVTTSVKDVTGQEPRSLAKYANDFKQSWHKQ